MIRWLVAVSLLVAISLLPKVAFAQEVSLICNDSAGNYALGTAVEPLNIQITCFAYAADIVPKQDGHVTVTDPIGHVIISMSADKSKPTEFDFVTSNPGTYLIDVSYIDLSGVEFDVHGTVHVSSFVLPESPIGVAALTGASLAAFGTFVALRTRKTRLY